MHDSQALAAKQARKRKISMMCFILGGILLISIFVLLVVVIVVSKMKPYAKFWSTSIDLFSEIYNSKSNKVGKDSAAWFAFCNQVILKINDGDKNKDDPSATALSTTAILDHMKKINDKKKDKKDYLKPERLFPFAGALYFYTFAEEIDYIKAKFNDPAGQLHATAQGTYKHKEFAKLSNNSFNSWYDLKADDKAKHLFNFYFEHLGASVDVKGKKEGGLARVKLCYTLFSNVLDPIVDKLAEDGAMVKIGQMN